MVRDQFILGIDDEIIVDNFAGGGGASTGIELALGRSVDIAINHDSVALAMHQVNHPQTVHLAEDVRAVDPVEVTKGRPVGLAWFSPDCKHHSKARGGKPKDKNIRGLAWVVVKWATRVRPRVIMLENVEEFEDWCPLDANDNPSPWRPRWFFECLLGALRRRGYKVEHRELRACDYGAPTIRKRLFLIARCDGKPIIWPEPTHGAPDSPEVASGKLKPWRTAAECMDFSMVCRSIFERKKKLADATCRRIAKGIMRYVVNTVKPFVVPFVNQNGGNHSMPKKQGKRTNSRKTQVSSGLIAPALVEHANSRAERAFDVRKPLNTICASVNCGHIGLTSATLVGAGGPEYQGKPRPLNVPVHSQTTENRTALVSATLVQTGYGEAPGQAPRVPGLDKPLGTVVAGGVKHAAVAAFLAEYCPGAVGAMKATPTPTASPEGPNSKVTAHITSFYGTKGNEVRGSAVDSPLPTQTADPKHGLVTSHIAKLRGQNVGHGSNEPLHTLSAGGTHFAEVRAFLIKYYGTDQDPNLEEPLHTVTTKDRFALVTVDGVEYMISDIGLRMLAARELFRAQGFPDSYVIEGAWFKKSDPYRNKKKCLKAIAEGRGDEMEYRNLTKDSQVKMCGNSVCPPLAQALAWANVPEMAVWTKDEIRRGRRVG
jgi:DNA (cytosine-5)-methyltransferase 1